MKRHIELDMISGDQRRIELARLLAAGILRLLAKRQRGTEEISQNSGDSAPDRVEKT